MNFDLTCQWFEYRPVLEYNYMRAQYLFFVVANLLCLYVRNGIKTDRSERRSVNGRKLTPLYFN